MLCSIAELGLDNKFLKEEDVNGIHELGDDALVGEDPIKYLGLDDEVIDFELTSNRGDLLSIRGMAYEIGAIYGEKVKDIDGIGSKLLMGLYKYKKDASVAFINGVIKIKIIKNHNHYAK